MRAYKWQEKKLQQNDVKNRRKKGKTNGSAKMLSHLKQNTIMQENMIALNLQKKKLQYVARILKLLRITQVFEAKEAKSE